MRAGKISAQFGYIIFLSALVGCNPTVSNNASAVSGSRSDSARNNFFHDQGVVDGDFSHDFVMTGGVIRTVESIHSSCGCAVASIKVGDRIGPDSVVTLNVGPKGSGGKVSREVIVRFTSGDDVRFDISYDFRPLPFASPEYIVFRAGDPLKVIRITFPGELNDTMSVVTSDCERVSHRIVPGDPDSRDDGVNVEVVYDFDSFENPEEGVILVNTGSSRRPTIRIPFLAILH